MNNQKSHKKMEAVEQLSPNMTDDVSTDSGGQPAESHQQTYSSDESDVEDDSLTHQEAMAIVKGKLTDILKVEYSSDAR